MLSQKYGSDKIKVSEKPMLAIAEGAGILSHRLGDGYEQPDTEYPLIDQISYSANHNYFIKLKDDFDKIVEKQFPLPYESTKTYKTTVNNQQLIRIGLYAEVENEAMEKMTMGFYTIEDELPIGSDITFEFILSLDEIFEVYAYPKANKSKKKRIVLARGGKDSKTLDFLTDALEKVFNGGYSQSQQDFFVKSMKKEIEKINKIGIDNHDSDKWDEIGTTIFTSFEQAERVTDSVDEEHLALLFATILINEYPDLIGSEDCNRMKTLLIQAKNDDDTLLKIQSTHKLKELTDEYPILIALFTIKMSSESAAKENPSDGLRLLQMHDQIVSHFKNRRKDEAFSLLDEAIELRNKYGGGDITGGGIDIDKKKN
jgi:molecular chaperone DnaK